MASQVRFEPSGADGLVASNTTIAAAAERLGVRIGLPCGGRGECDVCAVRLLEGQLAEVTDAERRQLGDERLAAGQRLACQARVAHGDCRIDVPPPAEAKAPDSDSAPRGEDRPRETGTDAHDQIRDAFGTLPTADQIVTTFELQWRLATDLLGRFVEAPLKFGGQVIDSLFGPEPASESKAGSQDAKPEESETRPPEPDTTQENTAPDAPADDSANTPQ